MSGIHSIVFAAASLLGGILSLTATAEVANDGAGTGAANLHLGGRFHSVTSGIADYDGFDRFRDPAGQPLPGWEQQLRSPG